MGNYVFNNELFDRWLNERSQEISSKAGKEKIGHDEMMVLCLKAQTTHFSHMEQEFRDEFKKIDKKFDRLYMVLMWGFGLLLSSQMAMLLKSFLLK